MIQSPPAGLEGVKRLVSEAMAGSNSTDISNLQNTSGSSDHSSMSVQSVLSPGYSSRTFK